MQSFIVFCVWSCGVSVFAQREKTERDLFHFFIFHNFFFSFTRTNEKKKKKIYRHLCVWVWFFALRMQRRNVSRNHNTRTSTYVISFCITDFCSARFHFYVLAELIKKNRLEKQNRLDHWLFSSSVWWNALIKIVALGFRLTSSSTLKRAFSIALCVYVRSDRDTRFKLRGDM